MSHGSSTIHGVSQLYNSTTMQKQMHIIMKQIILTIPRHNNNTLHITYKSQLTIHHCVRQPTTHRIYPLQNHSFRFIFYAFADNTFKINIKQKKHLAKLLILLKTQE